MNYLIVEKVKLVVALFILLWVGGTSHNDEKKVHRRLETVLKEKMARDYKVVKAESSWAIGDAGDEELIIVKLSDEQYKKIFSRGVKDWAKRSFEDTYEYECAEIIDKLTYHLTVHPDINSDTVSQKNTLSLSTNNYSMLPHREVKLPKCS